MSEFDDLLAKMHAAHPGVFDFSTLDDRDLTDAERDEFIKASKDARTRQDFLAVLMKVAMTTGKAWFGA